MNYILINELINLVEEFEMTFESPGSDIRSADVHTFKLWISKHVDKSKDFDDSFEQ